MKKLTILAIAVTGLVLLAACTGPTTVTPTADTPLDKEQVMRYIDEQWPEQSLDWQVCAAATFETLVPTYGQVDVFDTDDTFKAHVYETIVAACAHLAR